MSDLPSVEQCQEFKRLIDKGREHVGLESIEYLDFDGAKPNSSVACLSATNLFALAGFLVCENYVCLSSVELGDLGILGEPDDEGRRSIPPGILAVTDVFDICESFGDRNLRDRVALRARMVEAGVVAP